MYGAYLFMMIAQKEPLPKLRAGSALTKRQCLTLLMAQYDPCGLLSPVTLTSKILMHAVAGLE